MPKVRIDKYLLDKGLVASRAKGQALIMAGAVLVNEVPVTKSGALIDDLATVRIIDKGHSFVGRGGLKLQKGLEEFALDVKGAICVDVGASTGGFTDCLLQSGAVKVYAIDVGHNQLDWKLRNDPRVVVMEKTHIKDVASLPEIADIAVIDVSFISLTQVLSYVKPLVKDGGKIVALIKPQFEAGRGNVGKGGIVRDENIRSACVESVLGYAESMGLKKLGLIESPITGADGNVEFLACFAK